MLGGETHFWGACTCPTPLPSPQKKCLGWGMETDFGGPEPPDKKKFGGTDPLQKKFGGINTLPKVWGD